MLRFDSAGRRVYRKRWAAVNTIIRAADTATMYRYETLGRWEYHSWAKAVGIE